jgi:hypothetical protein
VPLAVTSSPRKRTRAPGGPADRVERSSPALRSPASSPRSERATRQTGVPPPRTGQSEMKPSWARPSEAGPPDVSSRICGCQRAGWSRSATARGPADRLSEQRETPGARSVFPIVGAVDRDGGSVLSADGRRWQDRYSLGAPTLRSLGSSPSRSLRLRFSRARRPGRLGTKKAPNDM